MPAPLGAPGDDVVCGWVPHHVIPAHKACLSRRCSGEACGQRAKARRSRLCQERRRLVLPRLVPSVLIAAHWPLRTGAAAGGARGRHCLRASLQLPGLAPQAICARLTTETARFSVARRSVPAGLAYTPVLPGSALVLLLSVAKVYLTYRPSSEQAVPAKHCSSSATATRGCALSVRVQVATQALQPREGAGMDFRCAPLGARAAAPLCKRLPALPPQCISSARRAVRHSTTAGRCRRCHRTGSMWQPRRATAWWCALWVQNARHQDDAEKPPAPAVSALQGAGALCDRRRRAGSRRG